METIEPIKHPEPLAVRDKIQSVQDWLSKLPDARFDDDCCPLIHSYAKGLYIREAICEAGMLIVSKIHKYSHAAFLMTGDVSVLEEDGPRRMVAPAFFITKPGTKRVIYTHEPIVWITVHATEKVDLQEIEDEIIAKTFDELPENNEYREFLMEVTT
jgi:hypothetical protein